MALNDIVVPRENAQGQFEELVLPDATASARGLLSSSDKTKLDGVAANATANTASTATPSALGVAAAGTSADYARADHVHAMPSAADVGAVVAGSGGLGGEGTQIAYINDDGELEQAFSASSQTLGELRSSLGLGDSATADIGTGSTEVAAGDHTHELTALDATGATNGHVLTADGAGGVTFAAASGGVSAVNSTLADILSVSGSDLVADDPNADRIVFWDDSAGKLTHLTPSTGIEIDGTNLKAKITSDPTGVTGADAITNIMSLTQAEYNAIGSPNASTLYIITDP